MFKATSFRICTILIVLLLSLSSALRTKTATTHRGLALHSDTLRNMPLPIKQILEPLQYAVSNGDRAKYISSMLLRFSYFLGQGVTLSLTGFDRAAQNSAPIDPSAVVSALRDALSAESIEDLATPAKEDLPQGVADQLSSSELQRNLFAKNFASITKLLKTELKHIEDGVYKYPYDLDPTDKYAFQQWNPLSVIRQLSGYVNDRRSVLDRRDRQDAFEVAKNFKSTKYPDYYLQNFHYQSDGWLSEKSAQLYDYQVESLFLGTADAMRRQALPLMAEFMKGKDYSEIKLLDVATGTGRFASFVMDNFRGLDCTVLDLSPFYLAEAKKILKRHDTVTYVEAAAELMPFEDGTFDAISCVYLFHELPSEVRSKVLKEMNRVLKPGGKLFFVDSAQEGEVPYDRVLKGFTIIAHEPYYLDYTQMNLPAAFADAGFEVDQSAVHWVSKTMSATKIGSNIQVAENGNKQEYQ